MESLMSPASSGDTGFLTRSNSLDRFELTQTKCRDTVSHCREPTVMLGGVADDTLSVHLFSFINNSSASESDVDVDSSSGILSSSVLLRSDSACFSASLSEGSIVYHDAQRCLRRSWQTMFLALSSNHSSRVTSSTSLPCFGPS